MCSYDSAFAAVAHTDKYGHIIFLRLLDGKGLYLPVYIGKPFQCQGFTDHQGYSQDCMVPTGHFENPRPVLSSFRPMFRPRCCAKSHTSVPAGDSESNALEKELQQKQSVSDSPKLHNRPWHDIANNARAA